MTNCEHEWVYAPYVLTSNPPQYPKICKKCGKKETEHGHYYDMGEYVRTVEKFSKTVTLNL